MTKKRLADLLKEEASKSEPSGGASAPEAAADSGTHSEEPAAQTEAIPAAKASTRKTSTNRRTGSRASAKASPRTGTKATQKPASTPSPSANSQTAVSQAKDPSEPPSDSRIAELEAALAQANQEKADLEKTMEGLQADLAAQQTRLFELKDSLDQAAAQAQAKTQALEKAEAALAEAKQTILKLTDAKASAAAPMVPATPRRSGGDIIPRQPVAPSNRPGYVRGVPTHTSQTEQPNPMLSDADIGWVD